MMFGLERPRHPVQQLREEMDRLLSGFFGDGLSVGVRSQLPVNVWENDEALFVELEVPGLKSEDLELSVVGNELSIKVNRQPVEEQQMTYHRRERPVGAFTRVLRLPAEVDAEGVRADLQSGVLTVQLPKAPEARPRKIKVAAES